VGILIQNNGEDGLRAACILDRLRGEEEPIVCRFLIIGAVGRYGGVA
jgi:hypothetical protein